MRKLIYSTGVKVYLFILTGVMMGDYINNTLNETSLPFNLIREKSSPVLSLVGRAI